MTLETFNRKLEEISQLEDIQREVLDKIRLAVENGKNSIAFSKISDKTWAELRKAGFVINPVEPHRPKMIKAILLLDID